MSLTDHAARIAALTDIDRSFLVEAGAGSGKTALMAGRITCLLASGVHPSEIAAVSFTEMAATELLGRISTFVERSVAGDLPIDLAAAFPDGVDATKRANLEAARRHLGELTCTTIHGFCQRLLKPYPVEADIDPGARILDPIEADLAFDDVFDEWLRGRLSGTDAGQDILTALVEHDPDGAVDHIRHVADLLRRHRDVVTSAARMGDDPCAAFVVAVAEFGAFLDALAFEQSETSEIVEAFRTLSEAWNDIASLAHPVRIMRIAARHIPETLVRKDGGFRAYKVKGKWQKAAPKGQGDRLNTEASEHYERCCKALGDLRSLAASCGLAMLVDEIRPLIDRYQTFKRESAYLDFEDLLVATRNMLRTHPPVRLALGRRYARILVDEFQDTDAIQMEILRLLAFDANEGSDWLPRPGAIFLVGDPKQAIYRFRGADVHTYVATREALRAIEPTSILEVTTNFRSRSGILSFVNSRFEAPLSVDGQPGFGLLDAHRPDDGDGPCVAAIDVAAGENAAHTRDLEAAVVAELCVSMIENGYEIIDPRTREARPCEPGDIALLAPTGTELWRYEAALEDMGFPVATQAGKGLFRRQEVQDLIALTRILADPRDHLALGAFLRGPMVGISDQRFLDAVDALPRREEEDLPFLRIGTDPDDVSDPLISDVLSRLRHLRRMARGTTPYDLLSQAVEDLRVRAILHARYGGRVERPLANVDRYLEMARPYAVRGLRAFSDAMRRAWEEGERISEARPDAEEGAISLITMHSAKGLEWPIVIPINTATDILRSSSVVLDVGTRRLTMPFLSTAPSDYPDAVLSRSAEQSYERVRLWYVAATRARDLLVIPRYEKASQRSWTGVVDMALAELPAIDLERRDDDYVPSVAAPSANGQDATDFAEEGMRITNRRRPVMWIQPSRHDTKGGGSDRLSLDEIVSAVPETNPHLMISGSVERGIILHKLMEEVLTGETLEAQPDLERRAAELLAEMASEREIPTSLELNPLEMAATIARTLLEPIIADLRPRLVPEVIIGASSVTDAMERVIYGVSDAVAFDDGGGIDVVVDWKSDVRPDRQAVDRYREQVGEYMEMSSAQRGLVVFMTSGRIVEVSPKARPK